MVDARTKLMSVEPLPLDLVTDEEAEALLFDVVSMEDLPPLADTILGDPQSLQGVLLIHGFSGSNRELLYIGNALAKQGHRVLIPVLPGHGTDAEDLANTNHREWLHKAEQAFEYLKEECTNREIVVMGHSLGGVLAINVAVTRQAMGLALLASPIRYPLYLRLTVPIMSFLGMRFNYDQFHFHDDRLYEHPAVKYLEQYYNPIRFKSIHDVFRAMKAGYDALPKLQIPVKMIYAKNDQTVSQEQVEIIRKRMPVEPDLVWLDQSDHVIVIDAEKEIVRDELVTFCQRVFESENESTASSQ